MPFTHFFPEDVLGRPKHIKHDTSRFPKHKQKAPKARPPRSLRDHIPFHAKLPQYSGPYKVGLVEMEIPVKNPRTFSDLKENGAHLLKLETVLLSIYYPAHLDSGVGRTPTGSKNWRRPLWLSRPRYQTSKGYGKFSGISETMTMGFMFSTCWLTKLPAYRNLRIADHWPPQRHGREDAYETKNSRGEPPPHSANPPTFPMIFFSHGLGGSRTCYSSVCGEFASYGFVVVAIEHRDGSGPRTIVNHPSSGIGSRTEREKSGSFTHDPKACKRHDYDVVDFIFPKSDPQDTHPGHKTDADLRGHQIDMRMAELEEAYNIMLAIAAGNGQSIADQNIRHKGVAGASSAGLIGVDWSEWKGRFHMTNITAIGHSFGAATVIEALRHTDKAENLTQGIIYDLWGMAVKPPETNPNHRIKVPMLGINSEAFMYWPENFAVAKALCKEVRDNGSLCWMMTVRGTVHISQSDFCVLYPTLASWVLKAAMDPVRAIDLNIDASLDFLSRVLPLEDAPFKRVLGAKKLLDLDVLERMPTEHRPEAKDVAVKLKLEHEVQTRLEGSLSKQYLEHIHRAGEEEVWLHVRPTDEEIARFEEKAERGGRFVPERLERAQSLERDGNDGEDADSERSLSEGEMRGNVERIRSVRRRSSWEAGKTKEKEKGKKEGGEVQTPEDLARGAHDGQLRAQRIEAHVDATHENVLQ